MDIHIITPIYNESYLLPFFLKNYKWAKKITFIYDEATTDNSLQVISKCRNKGQELQIVPIDFKDGFDDEILINLTNSIANKSEYEWVCCVDADEFILEDLSRRDCHLACISISFYNMYPHKSENEFLNIELPLERQRRYGFLDKMYIKPVLVFKGKDYCNDIRFTVGKHTVYLNGLCMAIRGQYNGMHLNNVNLDFAKKRRFERYQRMSSENIKKGYGSQYFEFDEDKIELEFSRTYPKIDF